MRIRWKDFELPSGIEWNSDSLTDTYGSFWIEPFERGFGNTMGNTLRRILISSIQGAAVTAMRIEGIRCEFENLDGVHQDTTDIVMNIKQLRLKLHTDEPLVLKLEKDGPCEVRAGDIGQHQDVEIKNPDLVIATISGKRRLSIELEVRRGRGFVLARENMDRAKPLVVDAFNVDSIFSPVQKVCHRVVGTRVGQKTDYERLEFEIWTNGVVSPKDAVIEAASIMRKHIMPFLSYASVSRSAKVEVDAPVAETVETVAVREPVDEEKLGLSINVLDLSSRTKNCLESEGLITLGQVVALTEHDLLKLRNFGVTSLNELREKLEQHSLSIGLTAENSNAS